MSTSKEYLQFVMEQMAELEDIRYRAMMGEYVLYYRDKVFGGIYDDRFLIKAVPSAVNFIKQEQYEIPYPGAKEMLLVDDIDNARYVCELVESMYGELPFPKKRK